MESSTDLWFLRLVYEGGKYRLRAFGGQLLLDPLTKKMVPVDESKNVIANKAIKGAVKNLTPFVTTSLTWNDSSYKAGVLYHLETDSEVNWESLGVQEPTAIMISKYKAFMVEGGMKARIASEESTKGAAKSKVKTQLAKISGSIKYAPPTIAADGFFIPEDSWFYAVRNVLNVENTLVTGPTGTGKTELMRYLAKATGRELIQKDMAAAQDPISYLLGVHRLKEGKSVFDFAPFVANIQTNSLICFDEINRAASSANNLLFPVLDDRRALEVDIASSEDSRSIKVHDECVFFASANLGSQYTGTNLLDRALLDRFVLLEMAYMPPEKEILVLTKRTTVDKGDAEIIVRVAYDIRAAYASGGLSSDVSHRHTLKAAQLTADGFHVLKAMELIFCSLFEGTKVEGERSTVYSIFMSR